MFPETVIAAAAGEKKPFFEVVWFETPERQVQNDYNKLRHVFALLLWTVLLLSPHHSQFANPSGL